MSNHASFLLPLEQPLKRAPLTGALCKSALTRAFRPTFSFCMALRASLTEFTTFTMLIWLSDSSCNTQTGNDREKQLNICCVTLVITMQMHTSQSSLFTLNTFKLCTLHIASDHFPKLFEAFYYLLESQASSTFLNMSYTLLFRYA